MKFFISSYISILFKYLRLEVYILCIKNVCIHFVCLISYLGLLVIIVPCLGRIQCQSSNSFPFICERHQVLIKDEEDIIFDQSGSRIDDNWPITGHKTDQSHVFKWHIAHLWFLMTILSVYSREEKFNISIFVVLLLHQSHQKHYLLLIDPKS